MDFSQRRTLVIWNTAAPRRERYSFQNALDSICRRTFEEGEGEGRNHTFAWQLHDFPQILSNAAPICSHGHRAGWQEVRPGGSVSTLPHDYCDGLCNPSVSFLPGLALHITTRRGITNWNSMIYVGRKTIAHVFIWLICELLRHFASWSCEITFKFTRKSKCFQGVSSTQYLGWKQLRIWLNFCGFQGRLFMVSSTFNLGSLVWTTIRPTRRNMHKQRQSSW